MKPKPKPNPPGGAPPPSDKNLPPESAVLQSFVDCLGIVSIAENSSRQWDIRCYDRAGQLLMQWHDEASLVDCILQLMTTFTYSVDTTEEVPPSLAQATPPRKRKSLPRRKSLGSPGQ